MGITYLVSIRYTHNDLHLTSSFVKEYEIGQQMGILPKTLLICKPCESYPKGKGQWWRENTLPMMLIFDHEACDHIVYSPWRRTMLF